MDIISKRLQKTTHFIQKDIWLIPRTKLSPLKSFFLNLLRIMILSIRRFRADKCRLHASALTFYSLMSIVPVAAMAFGIAKGFGFQKKLEAELRSQFAQYEEILSKVIEFSYSLLEDTKGGLIAGVGLIVLFFSVIKGLGQIEESFNDIWGVKSGRTFGRKLSDYLSLMLIFTFLIIISSSINIFITTQVNLILGNYSIIGILSYPVYFLLRLLPFFLIWGLFSFLYIFMPNTKVLFSSALFSGIAAGTLFEMIQWAYVTLQIGVVRQNAIYGSFAVLPLFLAWLQFSWMIILYGAELSFAYQNVDKYEFDPVAQQASHRLKTMLSLQITQIIIRNFATGKEPVTADQISQQLGIPIYFINEILSELVDSNILTATQSIGKSEQGYQPAIDIHLLTIQSVIEALEKRGINSAPSVNTPEFDFISKTMEEFEKAVEELPANRLLKDL